MGRTSGNFLSGDKASTRGVAFSQMGTCESSSSKKVGDSTLLDAAKQDRVSRDRSCREQLAAAPGQPSCVSRRPVRKLD